MWSRFWYCSDTAGPGLLDVARVWDRTPRYLRADNRSSPAPWISGHTYTQPVHLHASQAKQVSEFWKEHYSGVDWWLDATEEWTRSILASPETIALGVFETTTQRLLGTIVSRPAVPRGAYILMGEHTFLHDARVIEGLCIHPEQRGRHLAGWLISWMDYTTHCQRPTAHFWFREVPMQAPTTEVGRATWAYARISELPTSSLPVTEISVDTFSQWWRASVPNWRHTKAIFGSEIRMKEECWKIRRCGNAVLVFLNTRRRTRPDNEVIWEVAWCGELRSEGLLFPGLQEEKGRAIIEATAKTVGEGLVFGTDEPHKGGASSAWRQPWKFGTSGMHLTYIYNYMPPAFWSCDIQLLRSEI